jgi:tryptophan synthase alpha chain
MKSIRNVFANEHKALIGFITCGYPSLMVNREVINIMAESGCDIIELGIPFSDPLGDGPTIQRSSYYSLKEGTTPETCLEFAGEIANTVSVPILLMTYFNNIFQFGYERFCHRCQEARVPGIIVPDIPPEEGQELNRIANTHDVDMIYLLNPNSTRERIRIVSARTNSFIYLVSVLGVTGARKALPEELPRFIKRVRQYTDLPLAVGFGVSTIEQGRKIAKLANGVIIGSKIIQLVEEKNGYNNLKKFLLAMRKVLS